MRCGRLRGALVGALVTMCWLAVATPGEAITAESSPAGTWQTNGRVEVIAIQGSVAYLGGQFTSVRPAGAPAGTGEVARSNAAAIDLSTGAVLPWNPNANNTVQTIAIDGDNIYLGGLFTTVGGRNRKHLAEVNDTTGGVSTTFKAQTGSQVWSIAVGNGMLYAGGAFTTAGSTKSPRGYLAAFDLTTGALEPWAPTADQQVKVVGFTTDGTRLVIGGNFAHVNGQIQYHLTAVSPTTGALLPWIAHPSYYSVVAMAIDSSGVYVAGTGNGGNFAGFNPATGQQLWIGGVDGNVQGVGILDGNVYYGGHFNNYCGQTFGVNRCRVNMPRDHLLAVDEHTGLIQAWHPSADGVLGIFAVTGGDDVLTLGGDFTNISGSSQAGFAELPVITPPTVTDSASGAWSNTIPVTVTATGSTDSAPGFLGYRYQISTDGSVTWGANRTGQASIEAEGTTLVRYQSYDAWGNTTDWVTDTVRIDLTAPTLPTVSGGTGAACTGQPGFTVTAAGSTDAGSGVAAYASETSTDGGVTWSAPAAGSTVTIPNDSSNQTVLVRFQATDFAGNSTAWTTPDAGATVTLC